MTIVASFKMKETELDDNACPTLVTLSSKERKIKYSK